MISQYIAEVPLNVKNILNNFKYFIKKVYQKEWTRNIKQKKNQNNYFREVLSQELEEILTLTERITD